MLTDSCLMYQAQQTPTSWLAIGRYTEHAKKKQALESGVLPYLHNESERPTRLRSLGFCGLLALCPGLGHVQPVLLMQRFPTRTNAVTLPLLLRGS